MKIVTTKVNHLSQFFPFPIFLQISIEFTIYRRSIHWKMNDTWVIHGFSYVCKMLQKIICCSVTHERRVPIPYLNSINAPKSVISTWQVWMIWSNLSLKPTDRNLDLLTSLTNLPLKYGAKPQLTKYLILSVPS